MTWTVPSPPKGPQRRGPDLLLRLLPWICALGWAVALAALCFGIAAKPGTETLVERFHGKVVDTAWKLPRLHWMFRLAILSFCASLVGMVINGRRLKRKGDEFRVNLALLAIASLVFFGWYAAVLVSR